MSDALRYGLVGGSASARRRQAEADDRALEWRKKMAKKVKQTKNGPVKRPPTPDDLREQRHPRCTGRRLDGSRERGRHADDLPPPVADDTTAHEAALDAAFGGGVGDNVVPLHKGA